MKTTNEIKRGDFIMGQYAFGCICGVVEEIKSKMVIINKCEQCYNEFTLTDTKVNVTKSRINQIGLDENQRIIKL